MKELGRSKKQKREGRRQKNIDRRSKHLDLPGKVASPICPPHYSRNRNMRKYPDYKHKPLLLPDEISGQKQSFIVLDDIGTFDEEWGDVLEALE